MALQITYNPSTLAASSIIDASTRTYRVNESSIPGRGVDFSVTYNAGDFSGTPIVSWSITGATLGPGGYFRAPVDFPPPNDGIREFLSGEMSGAATFYINASISDGVVTQQANEGIILQVREVSPEGILSAIINPDNTGEVTLSIAENPYSNGIDWGNIVSIRWELDLASGINYQVPYTGVGSRTISLYYLKQFSQVKAYLIDGVGTSYQTQTLSVDLPSPPPGLAYRPYPATTNISGQVSTQGLDRFVGGKLPKITVFGGSGRYHIKYTIKTRDTASGNLGNAFDATRTGFDVNPVSTVEWTSSQFAWSQVAHNTLANYNTTDKLAGGFIVPLGSNLGSDDIVTMTVGVEISQLKLVEGSYVVDELTTLTGPDMTVTVTAQPQVNDLPTGGIQINGTNAVGETLTTTNDIQDLDGLGPFSYQWYSDAVLISGATADSYVIQPADAGKALTVEVTYTDLEGTNEIVLSAPTSNVVTPSELDFTLSYGLEQISLLQSDFTVPYRLSTIVDILGGYDTPMGFGFTSEPGTSITYGFNMGYLLTTVAVKTKSFNLSYKTFLDKTSYDFNLSFRNNKSTTENTYSFILRSKVNALSLGQVYQFGFPYRSAYTAENTSHNFTCKYRIYKQTQIMSDFRMKYQISKAIRPEHNFQLDYRIRSIPIQVVTGEEFILNPDGTTDMKITLDTSQLPRKGYKMIIDNGNRFLNYIAYLNFGQNVLTGPVRSLYDYTLDIQPYTPSGNPKFMESDVNYTDGRFGWGNAEADIDFGLGGLIANGTLDTLPGRYPYSPGRQAIPIQINNAGKYVFDMSAPGAQGILYLIDSITNRVIHISKCYDEDSNKARLVASLLAGSYLLIICSHEELDMQPGVDTTYSVRGWGPDFGQFAITGSDGYSTGDAGAQDGITFEVNELEVLIRNISKESSISFEILNLDLTNLSTTWKSYIPDQNDENYEPEIMKLASPALRFKMKLPSSCCFSNKIQLDGGSLCRIPDDFSDEGYVPYVSVVKPCYTDTI